MMPQGRPKGSTSKELTIPERAALINLDDLIDRDAWDQLPGEPLDHFNIFAVYKQLGPNRTLRNTFRVINQKKGLKPNDNITSATAYTTLAKMWKWEERAAAYDKMQLALQEEARLKVFQEGLALDFERVNMLIEHAKVLDSTLKKNKYPDFRLVEQLRGTLDDIAKEVGGRSSKVASGNTQVNVVLETQWGRGGSASTAWGDTEVSETIVEGEIEEKERSL